MTSFFSILEEGCVLEPFSRLRANIYFFLLLRAAFFWDLAEQGEPFLLTLLSDNLELEVLERLK